MLTQASLTAAILTLAAQLPAQAQAPKSGDTKPATTPALHFSIYGSVVKPGVYRLKPGDRISDALSGAAGPTEQANLGIIMLAHAGNSHNAANMVWVNFNDFVLHGRTTGNPLLQPGDSLYILSKGSRYKPLPEPVN